MSYEELLTHTCYIQTKTSSQNDFGEWEYSYTTGTTPIDCRMTEVSAFDRVDPTGRFENLRYFAYFKSGASISENDRIIYGSETLLVREIVLDAEYHHKEALLSKLVG